MLNRVSLQPELESLIAADDVDALREAEAGGWTPDKIFETLRDYQLHPLVLAAGEGAVSCLRYLLTQPTQYKQFLPYALVEAVQEDHIGTARLLVEFGVDLCAEPYSEESDEDVPISAAMVRCNPEMVRLLCEAGAVQVSDAGWLNDAIRAGLTCRRKGKIESLALLASEVLKRLEAEDSLSLEVLQLKRLATVFQEVVKKSESIGLDALAKSLGDFVDGEYALREEALDLATAEDGVSELRKLLLGLDEEKRLQIGSLVLPYLARAADLPAESQLCQEIISWGVDVNQSDDGGILALHYLAQIGDLGLIKMLVSNGAQINLVSTLTGKTELDEAGYQWEENETTRYLRSIGCKTGDEVRAEQAKEKA